MASGLLGRLSCLWPTYSAWLCQHSVPQLGPPGASALMDSLGP